MKSSVLYTIEKLKANSYGLREFEVTEDYKAIVESVMLLDNIHCSRIDQDRMECNL